MIVNPVVIKTGTSISSLPLGDKLYTFGVLSDIHLKANNLYNGIDDFSRAIPCLQNLGAEFVGISGDIGYDNVVGELELYQTALNTYATVPFHCVRGNHDVKQTEDNWLAYTGFPSNHEFVYNGDVFLFLSRDISTDSSNTQATPYSEGLTWIKERLERYKGARIFIFCHYPPSGYSGLADGQYYGWSSASTEDDELVTAINKTKNAVMFTGHTHYKFQVEDTYDNINIYRFNASRTALVHVPSCAYPRNASSGVESDLSQGYLVEVYEQGVVLRGVDLVTGELMPEYEYALTMDNNKAAAVEAGMYCSAQGENALTFRCDTAPSADVEFVVSWQSANYAAPLITFTINGNGYMNVGTADAPNYGEAEFTAEEGMSWAEWIGSDYNTIAEDLYINSYGYVGETTDSYQIGALGTDKIVDGGGILVRLYVKEGAEK